MPSSNLQFKLTDDETKLEVIYEVSAEKEQIVNIKWLKMQLEDAGYANLELIEDGAAFLINQLNSGEPGPGKLILAQTKDAKINISISKDKMEAYLTIDPPLGGKPASLEMIKAVLAEKGIRHGFIIEAIKSAIISGEADHLLIAAGEPIVNGENAKFICLVPDIKARIPQVSENGNVDYRDLGEIMIVHAGEKLMQRTPSTFGIPSKNLMGAIVNPVKGINTPYAKGLEGVELSKEDPSILVATNTGQPIIEEHGVSVESTMTIKRVNLASGNIVFDGSIVIEGDIEHGMKVQASGDINVRGMVESANLEAGGDIVIHGAIIGRGAVRDAKKQLNLETAIIKAKGSISAKFTENALLESDNNIFIQDWVVKSELYALNEIIIGNKNTKKGQIIGGKVTSGILIKAMNIGSNAGVLTQVQSGPIIDVEKELESITNTIAKLSATLKEVLKALSILKNNPTKQAQDKLKKTILTRKSIEDQITEKTEEKRAIKTEFTRSQNAKIVVEKTIYSGTTVTVGGILKEIDEDLGRRSFVISEGKLAQIRDT